MNFTEHFIRRPVMTVLLNAAIVLAGVIAYSRIPVAAWEPMNRRGSTSPIPGGRSCA